MCEFLLSIGLDLGLLNYNGHSALHKAAVKGQLAACKWLLEEAGLGIVHLAPDADGNTPAEMARLEGYDDVFQYLEHQTLSLVVDGGTKSSAATQPPHLAGPSSIGS